MRREDLLEACLQSLRRGASIDEILAAHPEAASELRPLLEAAQAAAALATPGVPRHALVRSRNLVLKRGAALRSTRVVGVGPSLAQPALAAVIAAVALALTGAGIAAAQSLPGDALYATKILAEDVMLRLASGPASRLQLEGTYDSRRADEVRRLLALGRVVPVTFVGLVQESTIDSLRVADIAVRLGADTRLEGEPQVGAEVRVRGTTQTDDTVLADTVRLQAFDLFGSIESIGPQAWGIAGRTLDVTSESVIEPGLAVGDTVVARVHVDGDGTLSLQRVSRFAPPTAVPSPSPTLPEPTVTPTPLATATPEPTATREPTQEANEESPEETRNPEAADDHGDESEDGDEVDFSGTVEAVGSSQWVVDGQVVRIDGSTEIRDDPQVGDTVKVKARRQSDGSLLAKKIEGDD